MLAGIVYSEESCFSGFDIVYCAKQDTPTNLATLKILQQCFDLLMSMSNINFYLLISNCLLGLRADRQYILTRIQLCDTDQHFCFIHHCFDLL